MFIDLFYLMRARGLNVSMNEWLSLMDALEKGLCRNSLLEFYYLSRAILIKTEADFDKFDEVFLDYFDRIQHIEDIPQELMDWLHDPKNMKKYSAVSYIFMMLFQACSAVVPACSSSTLMPLSLNT